MLTRDGKHLRVFEDFVADRSLPKFKGKKSRQQVPGIINLAESDSFDGEEGPEDSFFADGLLVDSGGEIVVGGSFATVGPRSRRRWLNRLKFWKRKPKVVRATMSVIEFFGSVRDSVEQLELVAGRAEGYAAAIKATVVSGQEAFREKLVKNLLGVRAETQLLAMGLSKYLREETVVEFVKQSPRGLRLDFIKNFTRVVPPELLKLKAEADERSIFDNYAVLHYDPESKSWAETEKEKAKRKDPILFGLMDGRRLLYYVGDWVDEFCDLTLDQIADKLGKTVVESIPKDVTPDIREAAGTGPARVGERV
jgi:hypothetical protein